MKSDRYMGPKVENFLNCRGIEAVFRFTWSDSIYNDQGEIWQGREYTMGLVTYRTPYLVLISKEGE